MKEKKRKLNQNKKKLSERRNPHSLKTKNQKPKKPQQQLILLMIEFFIPSKFYFSDKQNITPRQETQKIIPIIIKNKRKEKKQKGAKNSKLN